MEDKYEKLNLYFNTDPNQTRNNLMSIENSIAKLLYTNNYAEIEKTIDNIESKLDFVDDDVKDLKSYYLGKVHAITEILKLTLIPYKDNAEIKQLAEKEKNILLLISYKFEVTPNEIRDILQINDSDRTNQLSRLREKGLVTFRSSGRNRWYSLTAKGHKIANVLQKAKILTKDNYTDDYKEQMEDKKLTVENIFEDYLLSK